ncbi:MAG: hypothetical protein OXF23_06815, partial [Candidatus Dadabacteria bacterium]|nr:hypothetical protein [Candidatus Dadabacteria bacterium]
VGNTHEIALTIRGECRKMLDDIHEVVQVPEHPVDLFSAMEGFRLTRGEGLLLDYLSYMANRLRGCLCILKRTGSIYLHRDITTNRSPRAVMYAVFG